MGDVDDAFAIAALLCSTAPIVALSSVAGNTSEQRASANNATLAARLGFRGPLLRGSEVAAFLSSRPSTTVLALGPLTNVAAAIRNGAVIDRLIFVGGNRSTRGRWPPWWPHEFNLTRDRRSAVEVFHADAALTIFPLDVARQLTVTKEDLASVGGELGTFLESGARRWLTRLRFLKGTGRFPVYDLAAALYLLDPEKFKFDRMHASMRANTFIQFERGGRLVEVCRSFDPRQLWSAFLQLVDR